MTNMRDIERRDEWLALQFYITGRYGRLITGTQNNLIYGGMVTKVGIRNWK